MCSQNEKSHQNSSKSQLTHTQKKKEFRHVSNVPVVVMKIYKSGENFSLIWYYVIGGQANAICMLLHIEIHMSDQNLRISIKYFLQFTCVITHFELLIDDNIVFI